MKKACEGIKNFFEKIYKKPRKLDIFRWFTTLEEAAV